MSASEKYRAEFAAMRTSLRLNNRASNFVELVICELEALEEMCGEPIIAAAFEQREHNRDMKERMRALEKTRRRRNIPRGRQVGG